MNDINSTVLPRRKPYLDPWLIGPCSWGWQGPVRRLAHCRLTLCCFCSSSNPLFSNLRHVAFLFCDHCETVRRPWLVIRGVKMTGAPALKVLTGSDMSGLLLKTEAGEKEWGDSLLKPWKLSSVRGLSKCRTCYLMVLRLHPGTSYVVNFCFLIAEDYKAKIINSVWFIWTAVLAATQFR